MLSTRTKHSYMSWLHPTLRIDQTRSPARPLHQAMTSQWHLGSNILERTAEKKPKQVAHPLRSININPWLVYFLSWNIHSCFFASFKRSRINSPVKKQTLTAKILLPLISHFVWWTSAFGPFSCSPLSPLGPNQVMLFHLSSARISWIKLLARTFLGKHSLHPGRGSRLG